MTHEEATKAIFSYATRLDGYNGATIRVGLAFDSENCAILEVHQSGLHRSPAIPTAGSVGAAEWLLHNHPVARWFYSNVSTEA